jgi:hypothetical protein
MEVRFILVSASLAILTQLSFGLAAIHGDDPPVAAPEIKVSPPSRTESLAGILSSNLRNDAELQGIEIVHAPIVNGVIKVFGCVEDIRQRVLVEAKVPQVLKDDPRAKQWAGIERVDASKMILATGDKNRDFLYIVEGVIVFEAGKGLAVEYFDPTNAKLTIIGMADGRATLDAAIKAVQSMPNVKTTDASSVFFRSDSPSNVAASAAYSESTRALDRRNLRCLDEATKLCLQNADPTGDTYAGAWLLMAAGHFAAADTNRAKALARIASRTRQEDVRSQVLEGFQGQARMMLEREIAGVALFCCD